MIKVTVEKPEDTITHVEPGDALETRGEGVILFVGAAYEGGQRVMKFVKFNPAGASVWLYHPQVVKQRLKVGTWRKLPPGSKITIEVL